MSAPQAFSRFLYGHTVTNQNFALDFDEGAGELNADISIGAYSLTDFLSQVKSALDTAGSQSYTVALDRSTHKVTISADATFSLLTETGSRSNSSVWGLLGFDISSNKSGSNSYTAENICGSEYITQFWLQDFVSHEDFQEPVDSVVNETADGEIEVITFGLRKFTEFNIKYATNFVLPDNVGIYRNSMTGLDDLRSFMRYAVTKAPVEFEPDMNATDSFLTLRLESTPSSKEGVGYKLQEMIRDNLPGFFETGVLKWRVI